MKRIALLTITTLALIGAIFSTRADDAKNVQATTDTVSPDSLKPAMDEDAWQFGLTIPIWAPQIDGNVTLRGHQENVNISYNTLKEHLEAVFATSLEVHKGKYSIYGDVGYMKFSASSSVVGPDGNVHVTGWAGLKFLYSDLAGGYQLIKLGDEQRFILEGTAGVRYWYVSSPITLSDNLGNQLFAGSKTWNLVDPVLGLRGSQYFTRKFHLDFQGDGGGFNISHDTDWTWSAKAELSYDFFKWFTLSAGYQALALDESENKPNGANGVNLIFNGVLVELNFHW